MDYSTLSEEQRDKIFHCLEEYIDETECASLSDKENDPTKIHPSMWLSVIEMCHRNRKMELVDKIKEYFSSTYDWQNEPITESEE